jgi:phosphoribosylanthranilate isomerase
VQQTRIKICGITSPRDAKLAVSLGADYLGLIFAESPRRVSPDIARSIRKAVPKAMLVGVFRNAPIKEIVATSRLCRLNMVQLHGHESPEYCETLFSRLSLPIIKTFSVSQSFDAAGLGEYRRTSFFLFDFDKASDGNKGPVHGSRDRLWAEAEKMRQKGFRIFLAGSLNASNVGEAIRKVTPFGVDVARGVEESPGVKDSAALEKFISEVRV